MATTLLKRASPAALAAILLATAPARVLAHDASVAGAPGNPNRPAKTVEVAMSDSPDGMRFNPDRLNVRRGEQVKFVISNTGSLPHEFVLGTAGENRSHAAMMASMPDMKHDDPNAKTVAPGQSTTLLWRFSRRGNFEFACLIPGHYEAGMHGTVAVK
jgi:uncharacterized cupredoxin-like copper-binding protein